MARWSRNQESRCKAAQEREAARAARGNAGQLARLEKAGHGHCREAKRLRGVQ